MVSLDPELSKLFLVSMSTRHPKKNHKMAQLSQTFASQKWKPRFSSMIQKSKIASFFSPTMLEKLFLNKQSGRGRGWSRLKAIMRR